VDRVPEHFVAESLVDAFAGDDLRGVRILLPRAAVARDVLPVELTGRGATVDDCEAYHTVEPEGVCAKAREVLERRPHWITFTSSSTVKNLANVVGVDALHGLRFASIGPVTSGTLRDYGLDPGVEADPHTIAGLVEAIVSVQEAG